MQINAYSNYICPMDGLPLAKRESSLRCETGHSFDVSRDGYCNLLLVQQKASKDPGDSKEMVAARRGFLQAGHFAPIAECLCSLVLSLLERRKNSLSAGMPFRVVDAGCGEGYYLHALHEKLKDLHEPDSHAVIELAGFDISKWAIMAAAKRKSAVAWAVASNRQIPFPKSEIDLILSLFGFPIWSSFREAQREGGYVLLVDPGPEHLLELREIIYPSVEKSGPPSLQQAEAAGYSLEKEEMIDFRLKLEGQNEIRNLLAMTPHAYRMPQSGELALQKIEHLDVRAQVVFRLLRGVG